MVRTCGCSPPRPRLLAYRRCVPLRGAILPPLPAGRFELRMRALGCSKAVVGIHRQDRGGGLRVEGARVEECRPLSAQPWLRASGRSSVCAVPFREAGRGRGCGGWPLPVPPWGPSSPPAPRSPNRRVAGCGPSALRWKPFASSRLVQGARGRAKAQVRQRWNVQRTETRPLKPHLRR